MFIISVYWGMELKITVEYVNGIVFGIHDYAMSYLAKVGPRR